MTEKIEPALSAFQWSTVRNEDGVIYVSPPQGTNDGVNWLAKLSTDRAPQYLAIANAALPDSDRRKITRERIAAARKALNQSDYIPNSDEELGADGEWPAVSDAEQLLRALESYLPPEA